MAEENSQDAGDDLFAATRALIVALEKYPDAPVAPELRDQLASFVNSLLAGAPGTWENFNGDRTELSV